MSRGVTSAGLPHPAEGGIHPGCAGDVVKKWLQHARLILVNGSHARYASNLDHVDSLGLYSQWQPVPRLHPLRTVVAAMPIMCDSGVSPGVVIMSLLTDPWPHVAGPKSPVGGVALSVFATACLFRETELAYITLGSQSIKLDYAQRIVGLHLSVQENDPAARGAWHILASECRRTSPCLCPFHVADDSVCKTAEQS